MEYSKGILELVESWINGNRTYVREKARRLSKESLAKLVLAIAEMDSEEQAHKFSDGL